MINLVQQIEQNPGLARETFTKYDEALNLYLPDSGTHSRYNGIGEVGVGIAVVITPDVGSMYYDPFDESTTTSMPLAADNRSNHPEAWVAVETDTETLGGKIPDELGRFYAFALGKLNSLAGEQPNTSFREDRSEVRKGVFQNAGGRRIAGSLGAASGLWAVHDHVLIRLIADDLLTEVDQNRISGQDTEHMAEDIERIFGSVLALQEGIDADDLTPRELRQILFLSDAIVDEVQTKRSSD